MINDFSVFSNSYLKNINDFINGTESLPKRPSLPFDNNYVNELKSYEAQTQAYFIAFCSSLYEFLNINDSNFNGRIKDAYYKIRNNYKEFRSFLKKAKHDYNESRQIENFQSKKRHDGSMSPSNPFYNIDDECNNIYSITIEPTEGDYFLEEESENTYVNSQFKKIKKLVKTIKKRNKKKLTKNQRKKLKKKIKIDGQQHGCGPLVEKESTFEMCESEDPQVMIQDFFMRYATSGDWSWSMWNTYITKIQETNPVWFDIFNRYSYEMGINWNAMFKCDVNSQNAINVRLEAPNEVNSFQPFRSNDFIINSDEGKSVIFTSDVMAPVDDTNLNELFCAACKKEFKTRRAFHIHLRGVKHIQNEINFVKDQKPERFITEVEKENCVVLSDISKEEKHFKWLLYNEDNSKVPGNYFCTICKVTCTSHKDLHTHLNGLKHLSEAGADSIDLSFSPPEIIPQTDSSLTRELKKVTSRIQIILNTCTQPLIGLNYVIEYQRLDQLVECKYVCDICKVKFERKTFIQHVVSQSHREAYLKFVHPDLYDILQHDLSSKTVKLKRLEVFAVEVENFEGRKKVNVMMEKKISKSDDTMSVVDMKGDVIFQDPPNIEEETMEGSKLCTFFSETMSDLDDDKEDGEVESSGEEDNFNNNTEVNSSFASQMEADDISYSKEELEAGEIENNFSDREIIQDIEKEAGEIEDEVEIVMPQTLDMTEFSNYELIYNSERPTVDGGHLSMRTRRMTFIQPRDRKVRIKEITPDIMEYFKQEAIWALNRSQTNNYQYSHRNYPKLNKSRRDLPGALLLPPMNQPVGPIYTGAMYYSKPRNIIVTKSNDIVRDTLDREYEFSTLISEIETATGVDLKAGVSDVMNDRVLLQRVQHNLVNKDDNGVSGLNAVIRQQLLTRNGGGGGGLLSRRHLLPSPMETSSLDLDMLNETLEALQQLRNESKKDEVPVMASGGESSTRLLGERMSRRADFLGLDQPPPPLVFPRLPGDQKATSGECGDMFVYQNMCPFLSPGMIEHHQSFCLWKPSPGGGKYGGVMGSVSDVGVSGHSSSVAPPYHIVVAATRPRSTRPTDQ